MSRKKLLHTTIPIKTLTTLALLLIFSTSLFSQSKKEKKKIFAQAEVYYLYEEYDLANQLYLLLEDETNFNIKYKVGVCYLNIDGEKEKSIPYLESASRHVSYSAIPTKFNELTAPLDAYFFLAKAYMVNDRVDDAMATLERLNNLARNEEAKGKLENVGYINQLIQECKQAIILKEEPIDFKKQILGGSFTDGAININPAVSADGNSIVYTERRGMINVIMYSKKIRGIWQNPIDITSALNAGDDCTTCALNADGTELYLYKQDNYDGNIYYSKLVGETWSPIQKLNRNINTKYYESHASISADGNRLYFTSNREGGFGGLDIYVSTKDNNNDWGEAVNLGNAINTPYNEDAPFITINDSILFFSSEGHTSMGGYDIFRSSLLSGNTWKSPVNIGYPINSTDDDRFFQPINNGLNGYMSMTTDYKKSDIFYITINPSDIVETIMVTGQVSLNDTIMPFTPGRFEISLINKNTKDTIDIAYPNNNSGRYVFVIREGNYTLHYSGLGYYSQDIDTLLLADGPSPIVYLNVNLEKDPSYVAPKIDRTRIDLSHIPTVESIDEQLLITNVRVGDINDSSIEEEEVLYYTVQVMALYNPVDVSYFKYVNDIKVIYNADDKFYRYTTGIFEDKDDAIAWKEYLMKLGYPDDLWVKKVFK
ncbi:MAG: PD40 domain-containing protein [Bacteroidales bacterium]|nr:PD40 domain-containing protein [Bacteroidales bacterium]